VNKFIPKAPKFNLALTSSESKGKAAKICQTLSFYPSSSVQESVEEIQVLWKKKKYYSKG